jgi:type 2 lantibiotic biosynthesis protein LanM
VDAFFEGLARRAATIDELLSNSCKTPPGTPDDPALGLRRVAAWVKASAADDPSLFARRLARDGFSVGQVSARFAATAHSGSTPPPPWIHDAIWIETALQAPTKAARSPIPPETEPLPFEDLLRPIVAQADAKLWSGPAAHAAHHFSEVARFSLSHALLSDLSDLCAAALYERFSEARKATAVRYDQFLAAMRDGGFHALFNDKPVLLRLLATITRQWMDTTAEFALRLDADLPTIGHEFLQHPSGVKTPTVLTIKTGLSDPHNGGHGVFVFGFDDGARVVYKPKDLRLDVAWYHLVERLNNGGAPLILKAVRSIARDGYGWTEFIDHTGCTDERAFENFFRRAGAWLALLHLFAANDMHQENTIAAGDHPVPIDLETILQPSAEEHKVLEPEGEAFDAAMDIIANSVMTVGLLPAFARSVDNKVFAMGGMVADWGAKNLVKWNDINSDTMRPERITEAGSGTPNLPHVAGRYARFNDHVDGFVAGFADYAAFLLSQIRTAGPSALLDGFAGIPVRKVVRPTRFYYMLLQRLRNHRNMDDGIIWSAQADFVARLSDWDKTVDPLWPLQRAERAALLTLNVPHFVTQSDGSIIEDATGIRAVTETSSGLERTRARLEAFDEKEIAWQIEVIQENTNSSDQGPTKGPRATVKDANPKKTATSTNDLFVNEADKIAQELARYAIRRGPGAAWIGLDWLGDSDVFQLVCLGPDLYNGTTGIALFLAAHAASTGNGSSGELALASITNLRRNLKGRNASRMARSMGIGAATGLGSVVYGFSLISKFLNNDDLLADAHSAVGHFTNELIGADRQLDVMGGSAGAILALLRVYRDTASRDALDRAVACGEHLMAQRRVGKHGHRSWIGEGFGAFGLNGMSHGAAGFAYALMSLAAASGQEDFAQAAAECVSFENSSYDASRHNWPDLRNPEHTSWPCQWCHGAAGIGLARYATLMRSDSKAPAKTEALTEDIRNALLSAEENRPSAVDTLCCGNLGNIEFLCQAADMFDRDELRQASRDRLLAVLERSAVKGDYRWNSGKRQFNLGLFRGLSGVGYTMLRQANKSIPNILIWE